MTKSFGRILWQQSDASCHLRLFNFDPIKYLFYFQIEGRIDSRQKLDCLTNQLFPGTLYCLYSL